MGEPLELWFERDAAQNLQSTRRFVLSSGLVEDAKLAWRDGEEEAVHSPRPHTSFCGRLEPAARLKLPSLCEPLACKAATYCEWSSPNQLGLFTGSRSTT